MKRLFITVFAVSTITSSILACTNFIITKGATVDGSTMITYAADAHVLYGELYFFPREKYNEKDSMVVYDWDTGKRLGKIKQAKETYQVVGNMNEYQLAIGETTFGGRPELVDTTGIIDYGSMMYIALQRAKNAREAIVLIGSLLNEYGYNSSGESFSIADPNEVWIMEIISKGPVNKGAVWVAQKIPDGYISGHANQARITNFPLDDPDNCLYAEDVISFARNMGYYDGPDEKFSFSDIYAPVDFEGARFCEARVWSGFRKVNSNMEQYEDYAMGYNLENRMPLWIKPEKKLSVGDVMNLMRDYFQGTKMDMTQDIGAGPFDCIVRWRPLTWEIDSKTYFNERAISTQQTGFSFVAQGRSWLPDPIGGILWFGVDDTYSTVYNPIYCGINKVPNSYAVGNGSIMEFSDDAAFWVFNQVSNFAYTRYSLIIPDIQKKQSGLEAKFFNEVAEIDEKALSLYKKDRLEAIEIITNYSVSTADSTVKEWKELYKYLFTRYMDGNVKIAVPVPENHKYMPPEYEQPGYSESWYRKIIEQTGDKFLEPERSHH